MKKKITILAIVSIIAVVILSTVFVASNITSIQEWLQKANLTEEVQADENSGISTFAANATGYKIYGKEPFTEEYSVGAFVTADLTDGYNFGSGFAHVGRYKDRDLNIYVGTNKTKDLNVYRDTYNGFRMGSQSYDIRIYFWLVEGDDFVLDGDNFGGFTEYQSTGFTFPDNYKSTSVPTVVTLEIHFYESGTLATNNPIEVPVKGIISMNDIDTDEGFVFIKGEEGIYLTENTTIVPGSQIKNSIYSSSISDGWFGTINRG